jgi:hypothetical protein
MSQSRPGRSPATSSSTERLLRSSTLIVDLGRRVEHPHLARRAARHPSGVSFGLCSDFPAPTRSRAGARRRRSPSRRPRARGRGRGCCRRRRRDARIDDRQAELVEHRGAAREAVLPVRRVDHDRRGAAVVARACSDTTGSSASPDRAPRARACARRSPRANGAGNRRRTASPRRRSMASAGDAGPASRPRARLLVLAHQLVLVDRALQPAAQRALDALVELVEQRGLPGVPQLRVRAAHVGDRSARRGSRGGSRRRRAARSR